MNEEQKRMKKIEGIMRLLDDEFGNTKSYEWKASICHFVNYYDNMEGKQLETDSVKLNSKRLVVTG